MVCAYCSSPMHSIRSCNADSRICVNTLITRINLIKFQFRMQLEMLKTERTGVLAMVCKHIGRQISGTKRELSLRIMQHVAETQLNQTSYILSQIELMDLDEEFEQASLRVNGDMDIQYLVERMYLLSTDVLRGMMLNNRSIIHRTNEHLIRLMPQERREALPVVETPVKRPLRLLVSEVGVQECGICYEEKCMMELGCSHKFCGDCTIGVLKTNKKCAFCRTDIEHIRGGQEVLSDLLYERQMGRI